jgi:hypothetical protein
VFFPRLSEMPTILRDPIPCCALTHPHAPVHPHPHTHTHTHTRSLSCANSGPM